MVGEGRSFFGIVGRVRSAAGGQRAPLHCDGRRCATTALRCSVPAGSRRTRPRMAGTRRRVPMLGAQTVVARRLALWRVATRVHLRCSAPQRRCARRPPAAPRKRQPGGETTPFFGCWGEEGRGRALLAGVTPLPNSPRGKSARFSERHPASRQSRGRVVGSAPLRRRAAQVTAGCASPPGEAPSGACSSTEHRQPAQRDAGHARASSARARRHRAAQGRAWTCESPCGLSLASRAGRACKPDRGRRREAATVAVKRNRPPAHGFAGPYLRPPSQRAHQDASRIESNKQ